MVAVRVVSESSVVHAGPDVVSCDLVGSSALLDMKSSTYYALNPVGSQVWELIQQPTSVSNICEKVVARYDVDPDRCCKDVLALLRRLSDAGLVKIVD